MASEEPPNPMTESGVTIASDSEQYNSGVEDLSASAPSSSPPDVVLYKRPTIWSILRGAAINLLLPFINGMMLGFGELFAHEAAFRLGWSNTRVSAAPCRRRCLGFFWGGPRPDARLQVFPVSRRQAHPIGPGIEAVEKPRRKNELD